MQDLIMIVTHLPKSSITSEMFLVLAKKNSPDYKTGQNIVTSKYRKEFKIQITPSPDLFLLIKNPKNEVVACLGINFNRPFFAEQYLNNSSAEKAIAAKMNINPENLKNTVVELGSFASEQPTCGIELIMVVACFLKLCGYKFVVCTLTQPMGLLIQRRFSVDFHVIVENPGNKLTHAERLRWQGYFDRHPQTGFIDVAEANKALRVKYPDWYARSHSEATLLFNKSRKMSDRITLVAGAISVFIILYWLMPIAYNQ